MRVVLNDQSGRWFETDDAKKWNESGMLSDEGTFVSLATGNSWEHETLYLSKGGMFVMLFQNERNPSLNQFVEYSEKMGVDWLLANGYLEDAEKLGYDRDVNEREV